MNFIQAGVAHPQFRAGVRDMVGVSFGMAAWGLVTGVAMAQSGLSVPLALFMTLTVFSGGAQLAVLPLIAAGAPIWVVWATGLCVNLRFMIFSAQWRPYFMRFSAAKRMAMGYLAADVTYVLFMKRFDEPREGDGQIEYFFGGVTMTWLAWQVPSVLGIVLADQIPTHWGLGFAGTLGLLGLTCSLLSDRATTFAAVLAGAAAVAAFALPLKLNIVVAIAAAVCLGLMIDGGGDLRQRLQRALRGGRS